MGAEQLGKGRVVLDQHDIGPTYRHTFCRGHQREDRCGHGEGEPDGAPLADDALDPHAAAVGLDDLLDQGQPEPCATNAAGLLVIDPEELAEKLGERLRWDAHSAILHPELDMVALLARSDVDRSALWRKLHRIGEQVHEDLTDAV